MKILHMLLKKKWYRMIESGEKTEEYREMKPYWADRLVDKVKYWIGPRTIYRRYDAVEFTLGYPKKEDKTRRMTFEVVDIGAGWENPEWGAPTDKPVYIIKLGSRIV